ncbi:hypothetical protein BGZ83_010558 [Gryganskiella cystojenkinii]|nr:hypothetical protein BGZ83_010558 [Gryganskiella cystojenkinii]
MATSDTPPPGAPAAGRGRLLAEDWFLGEQENIYGQVPPGDETDHVSVSSSFTDRRSVSAAHRTPRLSDSLIDLTEDEVMGTADDESDDDGEILIAPGTARRLNNSRRNNKNTQERRKGKEVPCDPLVFQYPLTGGSWATMALYVDKDVRTALTRFSDIRSRQMSDIKPKTSKDLANLLAQAIDEEKAALNGDE